MESGLDVPTLPAAWLPPGHHEAMLEYVDENNCIAFLRDSNEYAPVFYDKKQRGELPLPPGHSSRDRVTKISTKDGDMKQLMKPIMKQ